jgi:AraC-like DNA-binding protein
LSSDCLPTGEEQPGKVCPLAERVTHECADPLFEGARAVPTFFDTNDFPAKRRFAQWRDAASALFLPVDVGARDHGAFRYHSVRSAIDGVPLGTSFVRDVQVSREAHHIGDPAACPFSIYIPASGAIGVAQAGREQRVKPGELTMIDTALPYQTDVPDELGFTWLHIPRERLPCRVGRLDALAGLTLDGRNPYARLAIDFIRSIAQVADHLSGENARRIADQALDLVAMAVAHQTGEAPPEGNLRRAAILHYAKTFIDRNLPNADLSLEVVAATLKVSSRYLSGLFGATETPYRTYVREQRLAQCARDLASPQHAHRSVTEIALSWGFVDSAHFSRCFKGHYGCSATEYRALHLHEIYSADGNLCSSDVREG